MLSAHYASFADLEAALPLLQASPADGGLVEMLVRRPTSGAREVLETCQLDPIRGLAGDRWHSPQEDRPLAAPSGKHNVQSQLTMMNARAIQLFAGARERWPLAGDQLYIDLDLSHENLPPGTRLQIGGAVVEITPLPHTGCAKFKERFGADVLRFVNSPAGRALNLRGVYARVILGGVVRVGDRAAKQARAGDS